jgi:hypothetical protein
MQKSRSGTIRVIRIVNKVEMEKTSIMATRMAVRQARIPSRRYWSGFRR